MTTSVEILKFHVHNHFPAIFRSIATLLINDCGRHLLSPASPYSTEVAGWCACAGDAAAARHLRAAACLIQQRFPHACSGASFGRAFWLCAQAWKTVDTLPKANVTMAVLETVRRQYEATAEALEAALTAVCTNFQPDAYVNVSSSDKTFPWKRACSAAGHVCLVPQAPGSRFAWR